MAIGKKKKRLRIGNIRELKDRILDNLKLIKSEKKIIPRGIANVTIRDRRRVIALYLPVLSRTHPSAVILLSSL